MFFSKPGEYEPCGMFTIKHLILVVITITTIIVLLKKNMNKNSNEIRKIIKTTTIIIWILEVARIAFNIYIGNLYNVNEYLPLYFCSILLYAGLLSSFGKGKLKRAGDVVLATGGVVGGIVFIICPTTTLPAYPMLHFLSLHSFFYHGAMLYIGLLINFSNYIELKLEDIYYYSLVTGVLCLVALIVNNIFDSNLMFISKDFPGTPVSILYNLTGKLFTPIMIIGHMTIPYLVIYKLTKILKKYKFEIKKMRVTS